MPELSSRVMGLHAGMTLIEVMISLSIIVIGLTAAFDAMFSAQRLNDRTDNESKAHEAIRAQIEFYQYMPYGTLRATFKGATFDVAGLSPPSQALVPSGTTWPASTPIPVGTVTRMRNPFVNDTSLTVNTFGNIANVLPLRFTVRWRDLGGDASVQVDYVFSHRGVQ